MVVDTTLVGIVMNGLSHLHKILNTSHFGLCLIRGFGGNLTESMKENFAKEVNIFYSSFVLMIEIMM